MKSSTLFMAGKLLDSCDLICCISADEFFPMVKMFIITQMPANMAAIYTNGLMRTHRVGFSSSVIFTSGSESISSEVKLAK